ncbi:probable calcium-binding protein CML46 [Malania oleifera]|uniref:probable calcium-binding protein CML46 n=1 Tax=Malania oleifera TaxID=397392 RepID=UPI0025ADB1C9|nr:probable calcium-binding protein CML46 [Malania oleifera]
MEEKRKAGIASGFSLFLLFLQSLVRYIFAELKIWKPINRDLCINKVGLCRGELEVVMERLGMCCDPDGGELQESFGAVEAAELFEEEEPTLEEVKEAFDVFDENRDGFIDASELQRVASCLGVKEGLGVEECRRMISAFDRNGDGMIDTNEFLKFMEDCFCK